VIGGIAWATISASVSPSPFRDAVLLLIWPLLIVSGTVVAWRWLGKGGTTAAEIAITKAIEDGRKLRTRLADAPDDAPQDEQTAWNIRVTDWMDAAATLVAEHAPDRLSAFVIDALVADYPLKGARWKVGLLINLDIQTDRLMVLRVSL
jgi:hypothetical protein